MKRTALNAVGTGLVTFAAIFLVKMCITGFVPSVPVFERQVFFELILGIISVACAAIVFNIPLAAFSITKGFVKKTASRYSLQAFGLGIAATLTLIVFNAPAMPMMKALTPPQLLAVLFTASISEELLCRGLVQGFVSSGIPVTIAGKLSISPAVLAGAVVFSLIHCSIFITGGSLATTIIIMFYALILGIMAGKAREQSNMGAAILTHMSFNAGGITCGILINILSLAITGHLTHH